MKRVLLGAALGGLIGLVPALIYLRQLGSWETWNRDLFYVLLVCGMAILGAVVGMTQSILQGFKDRHGRPAHREWPQLQLLRFFQEKPHGMHPEALAISPHRHRGRFRRTAIGGHRSHHEGPAP